MEYRRIEIDTFKKKNYTKAKKWYSVASKKGDPRAKYHLGIMYEYGKGFETFLNRAISYYRLGTFYEDGRGTTQDCILAAKMYHRATEKDHEDTCYHLAQLYQYGKGVKIDYLKAYQF